MIEQQGQRRKLRGEWKGEKKEEEEEEKKKEEEVETEGEHLPVTISDCSMLLTPLTAARSRS